MDGTTAAELSPREQMIEGRRRAAATLATSTDPECDPGERQRIEQERQRAEHALRAGADRRLGEEIARNTAEIEQLERERNMLTLNPVGGIQGATNDTERRVEWITEYRLPLLNKKNEELLARQLLPESIG